MNSFHCIRHGIASFVSQAEVRKAKLHFSVAHLSHNVNLQKNNSLLKIRFIGPNNSFILSKCKKFSACYKQEYKNADPLFCWLIFVLQVTQVVPFKNSPTSQLFYGGKEKKV